MNRKTAILLVIILASISSAFATLFISRASGSWFSPSTWGTTGIPGINDDVIIDPGYFVTADGATQISIKSLSILSSVEQNATLIGPSDITLELYVQDNLFLDSNSGGSATLTYGSNGTLNTHIGNQVSISAGSVYFAQATTFDGSSTFSNGYGTYSQNYPSTVFSRFYRANTNILINAIGDINLAFAEFRGGFESCDLILDNRTTFKNCFFTNSQIQQLNNYTTYNTYDNCHFRGTSVNGTAYITGPVAIMDNANTFYHLTIDTGGSVWGNIDTESMLVITHNLKVEDGAQISPGVNGTLAVTLGGNMDITGGYYATDTYFNNDLSGNQYNQIIQTNPGIIDGNFTNQDSELNLMSNLIFLTNTNTFLMGTIYLNNYTVGNVIATGGYVSGGNNSRMNSCHIYSTVFISRINFTNCFISDSNVVCNAGLNVYGDLLNDGYLGTNLTINGQLYIPQGSRLQDLNITLNGHGNLQGSLVRAPITFVGSSHDLVVYPSAYIGSDIINDCTTLRLVPIEMDVINFNNYTLWGDADSNFDVYSPLTITNVNLNQTDFMPFNSEIKLTLDNVAFYNCKFNLPVDIVGPCLYNGSSSEFWNTLSVFDDLSTAMYDDYILHVDNLIVNGGSLFPGFGSTMRIHITGPNLLIVNSGTRTASYDATTTDFGQTGECMLSSQVPVNSDLVLHDTNNIVLNSNINLGTKNITMDSGNIIYLDNHALSSVLSITGGSVSGGTVDSLGLATNVAFNDITITDAVLGGTLNRFTGTTVIQSLLQGEADTTVSFTASGSFTNNGGIGAMGSGSMNAFIYGSATNSASGIWDSTIHLRGTQARNLVLPVDVSILMDGNESEGFADFELTGDNTLGNVIINEGNSMTVPAGATLRMYEPGDWYFGNLIMNGTFINGAYPLAYVQLFHHMWLTPAENYQETGMITVTHNIMEPTTLPNNTGEYWIIHQENANPGMLADCTLRFRGAFSDSLALYISSDDGISWSRYLGATELIRDNGTINVTSLPITQNMRLAVSTVYGSWIFAGNFLPGSTPPQPLRPTFSWTALPGAIGYHIVIAEDPDMLSVVYESPNYEETSLTIPVYLAPNTIYYWKVVASSTYLGEMSSDTMPFTTRPEIGNSLPTEIALLPSETRTYYLPAFVSNLLPGEELLYNTTPSDHIGMSIEDNQLTLTPITDWFGQEMVNLVISDGYTNLSIDMEVIILGTPYEMTITHVFGEGYNEMHLTWTGIPGADYYLVYGATDPNGIWNQIGWSQDTDYVYSISEDFQFFYVKAATGELPE